MKALKKVLAPALWIGTFAIVLTCASSCLHPNHHVVTPTSMEITYSNSPYTFTRGSYGTTGIPTIVDNNGTAVDAVSYSIFPNLPTGMSLDPATGEVRGTPSVQQGTRQYKIEADGFGTWAGLYATQHIDINVVIPPPTSITLTYTSSSYSFTGGAVSTTGVPTLVDSNGATVTAVSYSIDRDVPDGMTFETTTGEIHGTPSAGQLSTTYRVTAIGAEGWSDLSATRDISITVVVPVISFGEISLSNGGKINIPDGTEFNKLCDSGASDSEITINGTTFAKDTLTGFSFGANFNLTSLGNNFLSNCTSLIQIPFTLPSCINSIGEEFLSGCILFNQPLAITLSVTTIGAGFLEGCSSFDNYIVCTGRISRPVTWSTERAFSGCVSPDFDDGWESDFIIWD